jgi:hypothetical protein
MSDTPVKKRCPNIAWAFWHARKLKLTPRERLILFAIAERADADLSCAPTQAMLAEDTGMSPRTVSEAVQDLLLGRKDDDEIRHNPPGCIEAERRREGLRYKLIRPDAKPIKPLEWPDMPEEEHISDPVLQNPRIPNVVTNAEPQISHIQTPEIPPEAAEIAKPDSQISRLPLMKRLPLEESPQESSLRSVARAQADNVVVLAIDGVAEARAVWNEVCAPVGMPACREMPETRRRRLQRLLATRFAEPGSWRAFCVDIAASDFLTRGPFGIDWVIKPANLVKIVEGNYREARAVKLPVRQGSFEAFTRSHGSTAMQPTLDPEPGVDARRIGP